MNTELEQLLNDICEQFPVAAKPIAEVPADLPTSKLEAFAACTTRGFGNGDPSKSAAHLAFVSRRFATGNERIRELIDVYYVEVLFWQAPSRAVREGWPLVPENLKRLFVAFHGKAPS